MLSNLLSCFSFSNTHHDSYMLLFRSLMLYCIHIVPEDPDVVEIVGAFTGSPNPPLPRTIRSIQSCKPLGEIEFGITEEDGV
ncbi:uncharacterized protein LAESUDRAFT_395547 [Laetiporus sulphureus 93-53]|uniref:Uncharacterized protein n=1 Tax=Laetiporus sulphureus 93-53 TaxID=1314785 RepID=A0A165CE50_9APHY|nr:uncharacterized protein LAESUDRAFT_395547 [Laetiporus sulphureus 93-53]KZT02649.1 hypothetical protein LAESUDRAFT_395547 [Laetiporus sulphureus 93-53]